MTLYWDFKMERLPIPSCNFSHCKIFETITQYLRIQSLGQACTALQHEVCSAPLDLQLARINLSQEHQCFALVYSTSLSCVEQRPTAQANTLQCRLQ